MSPSTSPSSLFTARHGVAPDGDALGAGVHLVRALTRAVREYGVAPESVLARAGLAPKALEDDSLCISADSERRLLEGALELSGDPAFGLHWAARSHSSSWSSVSLIVEYVPSFREVIATIARYGSVFSSGMEVTLHEQGAEAVVRLAIAPSKPGVCRQVYTELFMVGLHRIVQSFGKPASWLRAAAFAHEPPAHAGEYEAFFEGKHHFRAAHTELIVDSSVLDARRSPSEGLVLRAARETAEGHLARFTRKQSTADRVRAYLGRCPRACRDMVSAARSLGVSARSLRRRLAQEGADWLVLLHEVRAAEARALLERMTAQEAAYELGFADPSAFHRAFKLWTGQTPTEFKKPRRDA